MSDLEDQLHEVIMGMCKDEKTKEGQLKCGIALHKKLETMLEPFVESQGMQRMPQSMSKLEDVVSAVGYWLESELEEL